MLYSLLLLLKESVISVLTLSIFFAKYAQGPNDGPISPLKATTSPTITNTQGANLGPYTLNKIS
jgi:hypothetical protein